MIPLSITVNMKVCEIFSSIQGESTYAGAPCTFVRLTGCNLRCVYCDTTYAYKEGEEMTAGEILEKVATAGLRTVEITGGEPLLQAGVPDLIRRLLDAGHMVLIETNGTQDIGLIDPRAIRVMDIKTPGSGMAGSLRIENLSLLRQADEVKFVVASRQDYEWSRDFAAEHNLPGRCTVLFSPVFGAIDPRDLGRWIIEDRLEARLNLQLHKYLYGPDCRGV